MAHNYYHPQQQQQQQQQQQAQLFKPQNIYDQLKNQDPQRVPAQLHHLLGHQQPAQGLVQQRIQSFQQGIQPQVQVPALPQGIPHQSPLLPYPPQHQVVQHPASHIPYHAQPSPISQQYSYHQQQSVYSPPHPPPQVQRQVMQPLPQPNSPRPSHPPRPPPRRQSTINRPLPPDPSMQLENTQSVTVPPMESKSQSPARSRPLPPPTRARASTIIQPPMNPPAAWRSRTPSPARPNSLPLQPQAHPPPTRPQTAFVGQVPPPVSWRSRTPSPVKPDTPPQSQRTRTTSANADAEFPRRGRASPPKFSAVSISADNLNFSNTSSPSPGSSPSSSPTRESILRNLAEAKAALAKAQAPSFKSPAFNSDPSSSPPKPKPAWKKTLPDVLPPLLPTPPPNSVQKLLHQQPNKRFSQAVPPRSVLPPPDRAIPPAGNPAASPSTLPQTTSDSQQRQTFVPRHPVTANTKVTMWSKTRSAPSPLEPESESEGEDDDNESEYTYEYFYSDEDEPIPKTSPLHPKNNPDMMHPDLKPMRKFPSVPVPISSPTATASPQASPQYGIRDLPTRDNRGTSFTSLSQPPSAMMGDRTPFPRSSGLESPSQSGFGSKPTHCSSGNSRPPSSNGSWGDESSRSVTMRFAADSGGGGRRGAPQSASAYGNDRPQSKSRDKGGLVKFEAINIDDEYDAAPPRSVFAMRQDSPQSLQKRELMISGLPGMRSEMRYQNQSRGQRQRPQSDFFPSVQERHRQNHARPQSQSYGDQEGADDGGWRQEHQHSLQGSQLSGREYQQQHNFNHSLNASVSTHTNGLQQRPQYDSYEQESPSRQYTHSPPRQRRDSDDSQQQYRPQNQYHQRHSRSYSQPLPVSQPPPIPQVSVSVIESPSPQGGRDKLADIEKMESEGTASPAASPSPSLPIITIMEDEEPKQRRRPDSVPQINIDGPPTINVRDDEYTGRTDIPREGSPGQGRGRNGVPHIPQINVLDVPGISVDGSQRHDDYASQNGRSSHIRSYPRSPIENRTGAVQRRGALVCGGCGDGIIGRIVNAMNQKWHPGCFRCTVCNELLEHVSSYEWGGRAYCHLDYHEKFAPKCYHCKTSIIEERFISLDDPALGKRTYHEQHFFCAECGDPFLTPTIGDPGRTGELSVTCDGEYAASDDVGFTVYRGHPYCEACHVRLRMPKCKRCKRSIRDGDRAVEALGGKWCWMCFVCKGCEKPFEDPSFFQRGNDPYCENCFSIMLRNEV